MADNINPTGNKSLSQNFLPNFFRTDANKKFLQATIEQLIQPGTVKKVNGYIGRENAKSAVKSDIFLDSASELRRQYQLEPSFTVNDTLGNVTFFKDYQDYINQLSVFGSNIKNHSRLNKQEFYSWDPHIDWDKFVNFQNYYWLPNGPDVIKIYGQANNITSTYSVKVKDNNDNNVFVFTPNGLTENPVLTLYRGQTYNFNVDCEGHPFSIKSERVLESYDMSGIPIEKGILTFTVPVNCPDVIYYQSTTDIDLGGVIHVLNVTENSTIDVDAEIIGKQRYVSSSGVTLSNGMKISFGGKVIPEYYGNKTFYVEGVGSEIQLVDEMDLELISQYSTDEAMLFDTMPFDKQPFSEATSYAGVPDYIVINRASIDQNPWSRYNRWFHKSVIETSALINNAIVELDQNYRAVRPIIEFEPNLKLANFGTVAIEDIDLIDDFTLDVFSSIEGSYGYNIDGIDLVQGHKIIFTADTDSFVKNKVFQVEMVDIIRATQTNVLSTTATATKVLGNVIVVNSTKNMERGQPIRFTGSAIGNLVPEKTYYILSILNGSDIIVSSTINGTILQQTDATGLMTVFSVYESTSRQIHLVELLVPEVNHVALVHAGIKNQGVSYWYNGSEWKKTQQKTALNQTPLFDLFDELQTSYSDLSVYPGSTFNGTSLFSYKQQASGTNDPVLNFPLTYKTINNVGDIVFNFNLITDTFKYEDAGTFKEKVTSTGFLLRTSYSGNTQYVNGWQTNNLTHIQPAIRIYKDTEIVNNFTLDIFDDLTDLDDLVVKVYVNGLRLDESKWDLVTESSIDPSAFPIRKLIVLASDLGENDVLTVKAYASQPINDRGHYEIPINLQNNPLNGTIKDFTLGEVIDHVSTIVDSVESNFSGEYPGISNLRDLGNVTQFGTRFVQHSGPASLSLYHITSENNNIVRALEQSREDYNIFKKSFVTVASSLGVDTDVRTHVNLILDEINKNKPTTSPYYFSDMAPYGASQKRTFVIVDYRNKYYSLSEVFGLDSLSNKAIGVYLNETQLVHGYDYTFDDRGFVIILCSMKNGDVLDIYEYESTDGSFIPETPTKLGIWPKYTPKIYLDTSYVTPQTMIQGHDGSQILAYGDYRDELILELEKRIYNNIKVQYDSSIFNIHEILPSYNRPTEYSFDEFNRVLAPSFYKWLGLVDRDFTTPLNYNSSNSFTFNYRGHAAPDGVTETPGYWRGIYRWLLDSDRPNICPWEMLGFFEEPVWWVEVYGPAPYTSDNLVLWTDISNGIVREPNKPIVKLDRYAKPFILDRLPVDENGNLRSPLESGLSVGTITGVVETNFLFGDVSPVESAWRRSSFYPFSVLISSILLTPSKTFGVLLDRARIVRNIAGQLVYKDTGLRITPTDIKLPSIYSSEVRTQTAGILNYIVNYITSDNLKSYEQYRYDLTNITSQLSYRLGSFTSKEKFHLLLDSKSPASSSSIFVPQENYKIVVNKSSPTTKIGYSGVIVTKLQTGFEIKGYNRTSPFFTYYEPTGFSAGVTVNVGGISESYSVWSSNQKYYERKIVFFDRKYYRVNVTHTSEDLFDPSYFTVLPSLPVVGGCTATFKRTWNKESTVTIPYSTVLDTVQDVVTFLLGYGEWLADQGFVFDKFNESLAQISNWDTSAKEFMFWTTQNWSSGQDKWEEWSSLESVQFGSIVRYNGEYYRAIRTSPPSETFDYDAYVKLEGLSSIGSSVISLSPAASKITFNLDLNVVDDISNSFNGYEIYRVDGNPIPVRFLNSYREENEVSYIPESDDGIYGATFYLVQYEHVAILDNTTIFNDTIYSPETGYKQDKIKVSGYVSSSWNGSFNIPGFIFDQAKINDWQPWTYYALGDTVKYKQFYYSSATSIVGSETFDPANWIKLDEKPTPRLLPNWSYKASQFEDFYDLDSDNFDIGQQKMAQHLIGYQKRLYLENIIQDDVSEFKFYQGMISEKGTYNVLNKLFDVLSSDDSESLELYEEWAVRVGQYGASDAFNIIEFSLDESLFKNNPQGFELVKTIDTSKTDFIVRQTPNDIYLKPLGYASLPWPKLENEKEILRSAGHVRTDEVLLSLTTIDDILNYDVDLFTDGDYVWCSFESFRWNVYRYTNMKMKVLDVTYDNGLLTINTSSLVQIKEGSYIGIDQTTELNGFYKVISVNLNNIVVETSNPPSTETFGEQDTIIVYNFRTQRASSVNTINNVLPARLKENEIVWTDTGKNGKPASWVYSPVYTSSTVDNFDPNANLYYGRSIAINYAGDILATSIATGEVLIFDKETRNNPWVQRQVILPPFICENVEDNFLNQLSSIASIVAISPDERWLVTGSPNTGNATTQFFGDYNENVEYLESSIVVLNNVYYRAILDVPRFTSPDQNASYWGVISYIPVDADGTPSSLFRQGVVSIYEKDSNNIYTLVDTIVSPNPTSNEQFGSTLTFGENELFIAAAGIDRIYNMVYGDTVQVTTFYNSVGSTGTTVKVSSTYKVTIGMTLVGTGFTSGQTVVDIINETTLIISAAPDSTPEGAIEFRTTGWKYNLDFVLDGQDSTGQFGKSIVISKDFSTMLISSPSDDGEVYVYKKTASVYELIQTLTESRLYPYYGKGVAVSDDGTYIAVSDIRAPNDFLAEGVVHVYSFNTDDNVYYEYQKILNKNPEPSQEFGKKLFFSNNSSTLVIFSSNANSFVNLTFDETLTTFDNNSTTYITKYEDSGRIDIYDNYQTLWVYSESLSNSNTEQDGYGHSIAVSNNMIFVGAPFVDNAFINEGQIYQYIKGDGEYSWTINHSLVDKPDVYKIKQAFLYNKDTNTLITYLDVIDPVQGKYPGVADQEIKYKTFYDPAVYSIGTVDVNVDDGSAWTTQPVGSLWWDLRTAKFVNSYDDDVVYRNSVWNTLATGASIDIYEWVETSLLPSDWDSQADTEVGLALGISGTSLYGDDVYSISKRYDSTSRTFKNTYYYWVKNKKTIPTVIGRSISANSVSNLISNPRGEGYRYLALTGLNSFSLVNVKDLIKDKSVVLSVEYWTVDSKEQNVHSQWKLIANEKSTSIPTNIEQKWIDSLCGKDSVGREVPDLSVPVKLRYGIENRPRQSMFVNRFEALKQLTEQANIVLKNNLITETRDISNLEQVENPPSIILGLYDVFRDSDAELKFETLKLFEKPTMSPIITDGRITGVNILTPGRGYAEAPYLEVNGSGKGAVISTTIDALGRIISCTIVSSGEGYDDNTVLTIRSYSVLVYNDSQANGVWSIYSFDKATQIWSRTLSQTYNVTKYWNYIDWYASDVNQFSIIKYSIDTYSDLLNVSSAVGDLVKVKTNNLGKWTLLRKYADSTSYDWTQSYNIVGSQDGTIQLSSILYDFSNTVIGFDGLLYDGSIFDNSAGIELRIILNTLKDKIFIDDLKLEYLKLFFSTVRYAMSEQLYVDWIFKTSFIKAKHNVGQLKQTVTYRNDNLENFEDYVSEVKPYRTQVREYTSAYSNVDTSSTVITDFDLPPISNTEIISATISNDLLNISNPEIQQYPWKFWLDNLGFSVTSIKIIDGGSNYVSNPKVRVVGKCNVTATASAFIANGKVNRIMVVHSGSGYLSAPEILIEGGLGPDGIQAKAISIIGDSLIRTNFVKMKFDRISYQPTVAQISETETFTGTNSKVQFSLVWGPDIRIGTSTVTIDDVDVLRDDYTLQTIKTTVDNETRYNGIITFKSAPKSNSVIKVSYLKDWSLLSAADRIHYYYTPEIGDAGNDLTQLLTGVDYGGVIVTGLGFEISGGWGNSPYSGEAWDNYDSDFDDYIVTVNADTHSFILPYTPEAGTELNVYHTKRAYISYVSDGQTLEYSFEYDVTNTQVFVSKTASVINAGTTTKNTAGTSIIAVNSTSGIEVGDIVTDATNFGPVGRILITGTNKDTDMITVSDSSKLTIGLPIYIYGPTLGGITSGMYYVSDIHDVTHISISNTSGGPSIDVTSTANGILTVVYGIFSSNTVVSAIISGTEVELDRPMYSDLVTGSIIKFSKQLEKFNGISSINNGSIILSSPIAASSIIEIYGQLDSIRLDDPNFGTPSQTNNDAIMQSVTANGTSSTITIPSGYEVNNGDIFTIRKSTSDGSKNPVETEYDTSLSGGDLAYSTAAGIAADDIIIDGDDFVTPTSSPAPEEVVPGQVVDTLAIKIYDKPTTVAANVSIDTFVSDGTTTDYNISTLVNSTQSVIVKVLTGTTANLLSIDDDYTVNIRENTVSLTTAPSSGSIISVFSIGYNGYNIIDTRNFIITVDTIRVRTAASYMSTAGVLVYVDGVSVSATIYEEDGFVAFELAEMLTVGKIVTYFVTSTPEQTVSVTKIEKIIANGSNSYTLDNKVGVGLPYETSMFVRVGDTILNGPNNSYFVIGNNRLNYKLDINKVAPYSTTISNISVFADGDELVRGTDYTVELGGVTIKINRDVYSTYSGKVLNVNVSNGYTYSEVGDVPTITFESVYNSPTVIEVITSYNHTSLNVQRSTVSVFENNIEYYNYAGDYSNTLNLDRIIKDKNYLWVIKNGTVLTPSVEYIINDDRSSITLKDDRLLSDKFELISFGSNFENQTISYMQFKDMLNRVHYKRLNANKQTSLAKELKFNDTTIEVVNASILEIPRPERNRPGIIEIRGERIEYFEINGNVLSRLRRGTLGTGTPLVHKIGSIVQDLGSLETIPYVDRTQVAQIVSDGTNIVDIDFVPTKVDGNWSYADNFTSSIPQVYNQTNEIEVFVGGYNDETIWSTFTTYQENDIVKIGSYTYKCIESHTSNYLFKDDIEKWKFFVGNIRLKKAPYLVHDSNQHPYSPLGDVQFDADFAVDGISKHVRLTNPVEQGTLVTVVKRTGSSWDSSVNIRYDESKVGQFLKSAPGIWYSIIKQ